MLAVGILEVMTLLIILRSRVWLWASLVAQMRYKETTCDAGDPGLIPWRRGGQPTPVFLGFLGGSDGKAFACNVGDLGSIPGLGRSP